MEQKHYKSKTKMSSTVGTVLHTHKLWYGFSEYSSTSCFTGFGKEKKLSFRPTNNKVQFLNNLPHLIFYMNKI